MPLNPICPSSGASPQNPTHPHGTPPGSGRLAVPEAVIIVVVVLVLAALTMTGSQTSQALTVIVVAVSDLVRRHPASGRGKRTA